MYYCEAAENSNRIPRPNSPPVEGWHEVTGWLTASAARPGLGVSSPKNHRKKGPRDNQRQWHSLGENGHAKTHPSQIPPIRTGVSKKPDRLPSKFPSVEGWHEVTGWFRQVWKHGDYNWVVISTLKPPRPLGTPPRRGIGRGRETTSEMPSLAPNQKRVQKDENLPNPFSHC